MSPVSTDPRVPYLAAADAAVALIAHPAVAERWHQPSVLDGLTVGSLAAHLARGVLQVEWYLDQDEPQPPSIDAEQYYAELEGARDPESALNVGVRHRSEQTAEGGPEALVAEVRAALTRLASRLPGEPDERRLSAFGRSIGVAEYLRTRCVELTVHLEDLALSLGVTAEPSEEAAQAAISVLVGAAVRRNGAMDVLRSLTRTERDPADLVRVL